MTQKGKVYIASMNMRGQHATLKDDKSIKVNVTSAQAKNNLNRLEFSPMTPIKGGYKGYWNFESYWQSGKIYENIPEETTKKWWKTLKEPKRRYPNSKNKKVLYASFDDNNEKLDYISSRKKVYVPKYYEIIKNCKMTKYWQKIVESGQSVTIFDFDGPRTKTGKVTCIEVTEDILKKKINDPQYPFGHGYVVAGAIFGIEPSKYIM
jgi:hypothetical protein